MANSTATTTSTEDVDFEVDADLEPDTIVPRSWGRLLTPKDRQSIFASTREYQRVRLLHPERFLNGVGQRPNDGRLSKENRAAIMSLFLECMGTVIQGSSFSLGAKRSRTKNAKPKKANCTIDLESESTFEEPEEETCPQISPMSISEAQTYFQEKILPRLKKIGAEGGKAVDGSFLFFTRGIVTALNPPERLCDFTGEVSRAWCQCKLVKWGRGMEEAVVKVFSGEKVKDFKTGGKGLIRKLFFHDTKFCKRLASLEQKREQAMRQKKMRKQAALRNFQKIRQLSLVHSPLKKVKWVKDQLEVPVKDKDKKAKRTLNILMIDPTSLPSAPTPMPITVTSTAVVAATATPSVEVAVAETELDTSFCDCACHSCCRECDEAVCPSSPSPKKMPRLELVRAPSVSPEPQMPILERIMDADVSVMILDDDSFSSSPETPPPKMPVLTPTKRQLI